MSLDRRAKIFCAALGVSFLLAGCRAPEQAQTDPGVQDIEPGQKSLIQPPASPGNQKAGVEERAL